MCTIEHAWGRSRACAPLSTRGGDHANELVRVGAADQYIIQANDPDRTGKDAYRSARNKYEKGKLCVSVLRTVKSRRGKLVKYKAINELVRVGVITPMNWYAITPMNWYAITPMNWYAWGRSSLPIKYAWGRSRQ